MLAVVRRRRTRRKRLEIRGEIPRWMLSRLKKEYGKNLKVTDEDFDTDEYVNVFETDWYKEISKKTTPGDTLRIYRDNFGYSQIKLGELLGGVSRQNISAMEKGRRGISKAMAKKLSNIFQVPADRFI